MVVFYAIVIYNNSHYLPVSIIKIKLARNHETLTEKYKSNEPAEQLYCLFIESKSDLSLFKVYTGICLSIQ